MLDSAPRDVVFTLLPQTEEEAPDRGLFRPQTWEHAETRDGVLLATNDPSHVRGDGQAGAGLV